jgi:hypothetical protein
VLHAVVGHPGTRRSGCSSRIRRRPWVCRRRIQR